MEYRNGRSTSVKRQWLGLKSIRRVTEQFIPSNIRSGNFLTFCWDSNDINEETLTGEGTTHCTNGIIVQRVCPEDASIEMPNEIQSVPNRHQRTILLLPSPEFKYNAGKRLRPLTINLRQEIQSTYDFPIDISSADFSRLPCRTHERHTEHYVDNLGTPGWSGFHSLTRKSEPVRLTSVGYVPVIPTSDSTVYTLIQRSISTAVELGQKVAVIVLDQAIYCKAQEILWKNRELSSKVVLQMGAFHICLAFLSVIGKRFGDAGCQMFLSNRESLDRLLVTQS
jgi:hypothetical protein